jgi:hypothetical protein
MSSSAIRKQLGLYANLMEEVKVRFDCLNHAAAGRTGLPAPIVREFMYQQMRFLCELVALSCLVAHGDIASLQAHKIGRSYSADEMLERMAKLPHFYPIAVRQTVVEPFVLGHPRRYNLEAKNPSPLSKEDLLSIYGKTHQHLHRGSLKKLLSATAPLEMTINAAEIIAEAQKMSDLLQHHVIAISKRRLILCMLKSKDNKGRVQVATAERAILQQPVA